MASKLPLNGIVVIGGEVGVGKTAMALSCGVPLDRILYLNWDVKPPGVDLPAKNYHDFMHIQQTGTELDMAEAVHEVIQGIKKNQYDVVICDAWELFFRTLIPYIIKHQKDLKTHFFGAGEYKQRQLYGYRKDYESAVLSALLRRVPLVFIINHLDYMYVDKIKTSKRIPKTSPTLVKNASMRLYLKENRRLIAEGHGFHPCPTALVLKDYNRGTLNEDTGRLEFPRILPQRLDIRCLPDWEELTYVSVWDMFDHYVGEPIGNREPTDYETPDEVEASIIYETLTPEEREDYDAAQKVALVTQNEALADAVRDYAVEGLSQFEIVAKLKESKDFAADAKVSKVRAILDAQNGV